MSNIKKKKKEKTTPVTPDIRVAIDTFRTLMPNWVGSVMVVHTKFGDVRIEGGVIYQYILDQVRETIKHGKEKTKKGKR